MKISQGGVKCKITNKTGKDAIFTINLSSVRRHSTGPWKATIMDGDGAQAYLVTVALAKEEGDD
jgi:hypothetical protein